MKNIILSLSFILPIICHAEPEWELIHIAIQDKKKEKISKIYLDKNSIKSSDNDIRSFDLKTITLGQKNSVNNFTIMCSKGLAMSDYMIINPNQPMKTEKRWAPIFSRNTIMGNVKTTHLIAFHEVCADRLWKNNDVNTIEFDNREAGVLHSE